MRHASSRFQRFFTACVCLPLLSGLLPHASGSDTAANARAADGITRNADTSDNFAGAYRKADLDTFFTKLDNGQPVTVAAIGGSITMHRTGWALRTVDKIREAYPQGQIAFTNAGISGTGSAFGVFRLQRDVISLRPDLVFVEYAVNDGGAPDEAVIRNLETIVVALRSLPEPPAIVFVQSSADVGVPLERHNRVARHYGILNVNTQPAVDAYLKENNLGWTALFSDAVHPLEAGHALYAQTIWQAMQDDHRLPTAPAAESPTPPEHRAASEYLSQPESPALSKLPPLPELPRRLSATPLIENPTLIAPNFQQHGWEYREEGYHANWLGRYFLGSLQNTSEAGVLNIPFYGRTVGIALLTRGGAGTLRLAIDGELLDDLSAGGEWFYNIYIHPKLLSDGWHVLSLIPVAQGAEPAQVRIAFLLGEEPSLAPPIPSAFWQTTWPQSIAKVAALENLSWQPVPAGDWLVIGPFGGEAERPWLNPASDLDRDYGVNPRTAPDPSARHTARDGRQAAWQRSGGEAGWVDLGSLYGLEDRGVAYASLRIEADEAGDYPFRLAVDYFARLYVNGQQVAEFLEPHGSPRKGMDIMLPLQAGQNEIRLKVHAGTKGFGFRLEYPTDKALHIPHHTSQW